MLVKFAQGMKERCQYIMGKIYGYCRISTTISTGGNLVCQDCYATLGQYSITTYKISANQSKAVLDASTYFKGLSSKVCKFFLHLFTQFSAV